MGGEVTFDSSYSGNPLVNAMCVGIARHADITLARAAGTGSVLLLVGAATGRDGIQGASFASATLGEDREERRPAVQVGNPFLEKLLMEACLELAALDGVVAMQDLGAAGLTCALAELTARGAVGAEVDLDRVPRRERGMTPYEVLLSESQERMLVVVRPDAVAEVRAVFARYELEAAAIGEITDGTLIRCRAGGQVVCEVAGRALADDAPRYRIAGVAREPQPVDLEPLAAEPPSASVLLALLASPNARDRKPIWRRYDHMNGTNTIVGPGRGDAALLRLKGTAGALALAIDGPGPARLGALDPYLAGASAVLEGALNVACSGATPIGITDCLNFGSPETDLGAWQLERAIDGIAEACRLLDLPVVSGNVSLYNETPDGPILPTPVVGTVGLLDDRSLAVPMAWRDGDELWLIGEPRRRGRCARGVRAGVEPGPARRSAVTRPRGGRARRVAPAAPGRRTPGHRGARRLGRRGGGCAGSHGDRRGMRRARRRRELAAHRGAVRGAGGPGDRRPAGRRLRIGCAPRSRTRGCRGGGSGSPVGTDSRSRRRLRWSSSTSRTSRRLGAGPSRARSGRRRSRAALAGPAPRRPRWRQRSGRRPSRGSRVTAHGDGVARSARPPDDERGRASATVSAAPSAASPAATMSSASTDTNANGVAPESAARTSVVIGASA